METLLLQRMTDLAIRLACEVPVMRERVVFKMLKLS
jgi:hypothetical protein